MFRYIWLSREDFKKKGKPFDRVYMRMAYRTIYIPLYLVTYSSILVIAFFTKKHPNEILNLLTQRLFGEDTPPMA